MGRTPPKTVGNATLIRVLPYDFSLGINGKDPGGGRFRHVDSRVHAITQDKTMLALVGIDVKPDNLVGVINTFRDCESGGGHIESCKLAFVKYKAMAVAVLVDIVANDFSFVIDAERHCAKDQVVVRDVESSETTVFPDESMAFLVGGSVAAYNLPLRVEEATPRKDCARRIELGGNAVMQENSIDALEVCVRVSANDIAIGIDSIQYGVTGVIQRHVDPRKQ